MNYPELPDEIARKIARARRLARWTIAMLAINAVLIYLVMGSSQAMKTAWVEDMLSLIAPTLFLVSTAIEQRAPTRKYPFGFHRVGSLALFLAACTLLAIGLLLVYEAADALITTHHPTIGSVSLLGIEVWLGWLMIPVLAYTAIPPLLLGRMKQPLAEALHDKVLHTDADTNAADWHTSLAGIAGVLGIAFGFWWADSVAAALIAVSIVRDGVKNLRLGVAELLDGAPREIDSPDIEVAAERLRAALEIRHPGAHIRMRETGRYLRAVIGTGKPLDPEHGTPLLGDRAWRLIELSRSVRTGTDANGMLEPGGPGARREAKQEG